MGASLHSAPLRPSTVHAPLQQSAGTPRLVPDILARGGGHLTFLAWPQLTWPWNQSQPPALPNQLSGRQPCDSAIASVFFCSSALFCRNTLTSQDVAGTLHLCLSVEWSVLMASVDNNKHRPKVFDLSWCLWCDGRSYTALMLLYDNTSVFYMSVYKHLQSLLYPGRWVSQCSFLLTLVVG